MQLNAHICGWFSSLFVQDTTRIKLSAPFMWALYFLEPMLIEQGLGTSQGGCDRLASDELKTLLTSPT
jgi:hypothetical protein